MKTAKKPKPLTPAQVKMLDYLKSHSKEKKYFAQTGGEAATLENLRQRDLVLYELEVYQVTIKGGVRETEGRPAFYLNPNPPTDPEN